MSSIDYLIEQRRIEDKLTLLIRKNEDKKSITETFNELHSYVRELNSLKKPYDIYTYTAIRKMYYQWKNS